MKTLREDWQVRVVALTTDASGESRKARKMQINLVVGDYFKANSELLVFTNKCNDLITWLRSKTQVLGLIREAAARYGRTATAIIRPQSTRWTSNYLAYDRICQLENVVKAVVQEDLAKMPSDRMVIQGDRRSKEKTDGMVCDIDDKDFWGGVRR